MCRGTSAKVLDTLARALAASGKREEAVEAARKAVALAPGDKEIARFAASLEATE